MKLLAWGRRRKRDVWGRWPAQAYDEQRYQHRLAAVQHHLVAALDGAPAGPIHLTSICAGDGRDAIGVLADHRRRDDVAATLVELNRQSVATGIQQASDAGLAQVVTFLNDDATTYATYLPIPPAEIVLVCGVWGHVPDHQRHELMRALRSLCKPSGAVIWTRGVARGMHRLQEIESLFVAPDWEKVRLELTPDKHWAVATHRYNGAPHPLPPSGQIFNFY